MADDENLNESNYREFAKKAAQKYFSRGMVIDGMIWSRIINLYEFEIERLKKKAGE